MPTLTAEEMKARIGAEWVSDWVEVTQGMIDRFAEATGDRQFIHVDPERAARTPFGGTIAHGFLTLSLLPLLLEKASDAPCLTGAAMGVNYGGDKLRFLAPVPSGSRVRGRFKLLDFHEKTPGRFQQVTAVTIDLDGAAKPALVAEWINQIFVSVPTSSTST